MKPVTAIPISHAAEMLGIGSRTLFRALRERGILSEQNTPAHEYIESGELSQQPVQFYLRGTHVKRFHVVPTVTVRGWPLIETIARDIRHGHAEKTPTPLCAGNSQPAGPLSPAESTERCAGIMAILGGNPRQADFRAA